MKDRPSLKPSARRTSLDDLRHEGHRVFDALWKSNLMGRETAYRMLAREMGLSLPLCHFSMFDEAKCRHAIEICGRLDATLGGGKRGRWKKKRMQTIDRRKRIERMRLAEIEGGESEEHE